MGTNNFYPRYEIMLKCWQKDPDERPTFSDLKNQLKDMENQHKVRQVQGTIKLLPLCSFNITLGLLTARQKNTHYGYATEKYGAFHLKCL